MKPIKLLPVLLIAVFFFAVASSAVFAQRNSEVFIGTNGKLSTLDKAIYIQKIKSKSPKATTVQTLKRNDSGWEKIYGERYKKLNDSTLLIRANSGDFKGTIHRIFVQQPDQTYQFKDSVKGLVVRTGFAKSVMPLLPHGKVTEYYKNGNKKSVSAYNNNELLWNENWNENGEKYIDTIFYSADSEPTFTPGMGVMHQHILKGFKDSGIDISAISGSILIGFVVMEDGTIDGVKVVKGLGPSINSVAYQQFLSLKGDWKPALLNNEKVRYYQLFPINFIYKQHQFEFAEMRGAILHFGAY